MLNTRRQMRTTLIVAALAFTGSAFAADTGIIGTGSFKQPAADKTLPANSPFSAEDLASGQVSFAIRWDDTTPDRDPNPYRGVYAGSIRHFTVRIGSTEITLPVENAFIEVSDGADLSNREFVKLQASQEVGAYKLNVGWMSLNEIVKTGDLRGAAGRLASDAQPNGETLAAFQPAGRFDRSFFVTLSEIANPRSFPIYLQTSAVEIKPATAVPGATR